MNSAIQHFENIPYLTELFQHPLSLPLNQGEPLIYGKSHRPGPSYRSFDLPNGRARLLRALDEGETFDTVSLLHMGMQLPERSTKGSSSSLS